MQPYSLPDVTPGGSAVPITTNANLRAVAVIFSAPAANAGGIRVGDASVSGTQGAICNPGGQVIYFPRGAFDQQGYQLNQVYAYGTSTDKVTITYVQ
jgi:hypothetical protein